MRATKIQEHHPPLELMNRNSTNLRQLVRSLYRFAAVESSLQRVSSAMQWAAPLTVKEAFPLAAEAKCQEEMEYYREVVALPLARVAFALVAAEGLRAEFPPVSYDQGVVAEAEEANQQEPPAYNHH